MATKADTSALKGLKKEARGAAKSALKAARDRGKELLREEVPGGARGRLGKGVTHKDDLSGGVLRSSLIVSAVNPNGGGAAILHLPSGVTKRITLRGGEPFDFAKSVAEGTGLLGPRRQEIYPGRGRALLIGVDSVPAGESWIAAPGGKYIVRRKSDGMEPNPYHERAGERLEVEAAGVVADKLASEGLTR